MKTPSNQQQQFLPNVILGSVFQYLPPTQIAKAGLVSKFFNQIAMDETTWKCLALNLKIPVGQMLAKSIKAQLFDYYGKVNAFLELFFSADPPAENWQTNLSKDLVVRHKELRTFLNNKTSALSNVINQLYKLTIKNPKNETLSWEHTLLDLLLEDWINNPLIKCPLADALRLMEISKGIWDDDLIKLLLDKGVKKDDLSIELAIQKGRLSTLQLLLNNGLIPYPNSLFTAIFHKRLEMLKLLLANIVYPPESYSLLIHVLGIKKDHENDPAVKEEFRKIIELLESYKK